MKLIFEEYAQAVIAVLVAMAIVVTLGFVFISREQSLFEPIEEMYEEKFLAKGNDYTAFKEEKDVAVPEVYLLTGNELLTGQRYQISSLLGTKELKQWLSICIEECFQENFMEEPIQKYEDGQVFLIENAGVYWLKIRMIDKGGIIYKSWIKLFVNGGVA